MGENNKKKLDIIVYDKKYSLLEKYKTGMVKPQALKYAKMFFEACYHIFPNIKSEAKLFNLFLETFNCYRQDNLDTQFNDINEVIDAVNMFDDIVIALASEKGLNLCKVYINLEKSLYDPNIVRNRKYLEWNI